MAAPKSRAPTLARAKSGSRHRSRSTAGAGWLSERRSARPPARAPPTTRPSTLGSVQPHSAPWDSPATTPPMPRARATVPTGSGRRWPVRGSRGTTRAAAQQSARPSGTLTRKIARQSHHSTSSPPMLGPTAAARPPAADHAPRAAARRAGGVWASTRPSAAGIIPAAAAPWRARARISRSAFGAALAASEVRVKARAEPMNSTRRPRVSASRPAAASRAAKSTA